MLDITGTAGDGITLTVPGVIEVEERSYLAIPVSGQMADLPRFAPPIIDRLMSWLGERGLKPLEFFFRYRSFGSDGSVRLEVGAVPDGSTEPEGDVIAGTLPAGRYAKATLTGPYDRLYDAFAMLDGWQSHRGAEAERLPSGEVAGQFEFYRIGPAQESDPMKWQTDILIKTI